MTHTRTPASATTDAAVRPATFLPLQTETQFSWPDVTRGCEELHCLYWQSPHRNKSGDSIKEYIAENIEPEHAAYIVAACNSYPQLVADRAQLLAALRKLGAGSPSTVRSVNEATAILRSLGEDV